MIYLDNSATTRMDDRVLEAMLPWLRDQYGNASSVYALGRAARVAVENAREELAHLINAHPAEILFTSGGTESNNTVLKSCCGASRLASALVVSSIEHHAVLHPAEILHEQGIPLHLLSVSDEGVAHVEECVEVLAKAFAHDKPHREKNVLISLMHANNETGAIQPIRRLRELAPTALLHTDAVQSFGKIPFDVQKLGVDFATLSAHKIHGPKGIGALFVRKGIDFKAHQQGGSQERNRRAGTESPALIVGFVTAARLAVQEMEARAAIMRERTTLLRTLLAEQIPHLRFNTPQTNALPSIVNVSFTDAERLDGEAILQSMDMRGVAVSNGSACVSGSLQPSHVLVAMHRPHAEAKAAVRFSISKDTTTEEIHEAVEALREIVSAMRELQLKITTAPTARVVA